MHKTSNFSKQEPIHSSKKNQIEFRYIKTQNDFILCWSEFASPASLLLINILPDKCREEREQRDRFGTIYLGLLTEERGVWWWLFHGDKGGCSQVGFRRRKERKGDVRGEERVIGFGCFSTKGELGRRGF